MSELRDIESWLSASQAGDMIGVSGQWISTMARNGDIGAVRTSLGWLINPVEAARIAADRIAEAEKRTEMMRAARKELYGDPESRTEER